MTEPQLISLREHPHAAPAIRRAKSVAALAGFALGTLLGLRGGLAFAPAVLRGLIFGTIANLVVWGASIVIWRRLLSAHATGVVMRLRKERVAGSEHAE